mmetsp:Transcript_3672/g.10716  ORF Transcript_3672/g.10716 Transcript_3672/m.10716 type:complete len:284 (-) Transcript_3672:60-911(-)
MPCPFGVLRQRLLHSDSAYVVIHKPAMLPCQPDNANALESVAARTAAALGTERLLLVHRLDTCTEGCLVLAKNAAAQRSFNGWMQKKKVKKEYKVLTTRPVETGLRRDWMCGGDFREYSKTFGPGPRLLATCAPEEGEKTALDFHGQGWEWKECLLEVMSCTPVERNEYGEFLYESRVKLITGRTHQIRAQFSAMGSPIVGDSLYLPMSGKVLDGALRSAAALEDFISTREAEVFTVPAWPIGLQACSVEFAGRTVQARPPWWKRPRSFTFNKRARNNDDGNC